MRCVRTRRTEGEAEVTQVTRARDEAEQEWAAKEGARRDRKAAKGKVRAVPNTHSRAR
jgi:hypothetical protein